MTFIIVQYLMIFLQVPSGIGNMPGLSETFSIRCPAQAAM